MKLIKTVLKKIQSIPFNQSLEQKYNNNLAYLQKLNQGKSDFYNITSYKKDEEESIIAELLVEIPIIKLIFMIFNKVFGKKDDDLKHFYFLAFEDNKAIIYKMKNKKIKTQYILLEDDYLNTLKKYINESDKNNIDKQYNLPVVLRVANIEKLKFLSYGDKASMITLK